MSCFFFPFFCVFFCHWPSWVRNKAQWVRLAWTSPSSVSPSPDCECSVKAFPRWPLVSLRPSPADDALKFNKGPMAAIKGSLDDVGRPPSFGVGAFMDYSLPEAILYSEESHVKGSSSEIPDRAALLCEDSHHAIFSFIAGKFVHNHEFQNTI